MNPPKFSIALIFKNHLPACLFPILLLWATITCAQDQIVSRAFLEDPTQKWTIDDVVQKGFTPFDGLLVRGYSDNAHWVRFQVRAEPSSPTSILQLRIRPTVLDEVQLYEPDPQQEGHWRVRRTGDRVSFDESERSNSALGFLIHPSAPLTTYYLRMQTSSSSLLYVQALTPAQAHRKDAWLELLHIVSMTILGWTLLWALRAWWFERQPLTGAFAAYEACNMVYLMLHLGLGASLEPSVWPGVINQLTSISTMAMMALAMRFHRSVFQAYTAPRPMLLLMDLLWLSVAPGAIFVFALGHERLALQFSSIMGVLMSVASAVALFTIRSSQPLLPGLTFFRTLYFGLLILPLASLLPFLGWSDGVEWNLQTIVIYSIVNSLLMLTMLWKQSQLREVHAQEQNQAMIRLHAQLDVEKQHTENNRRFIDMLTHEVKTPVGVALLSVDALKTNSAYAGRIRRALTNINAVIDRIRLSNLAEEQRLTPQWTEQTLGPLLLHCADSSIDPTRVKVLVGEEVQVRTDFQLVEIILNNLIDNALKYSAAATDVHVELIRHGPGWTVRVGNTVDGVMAPDEQRLFSKYHRDPSAQGFSGSGLGLYLSRQIAQLLGAQLHYGHEADRIHFDLWLPA